MDRQEASIRKTLDEYSKTIPLRCLEGLVNYVVHGERVGSFLGAILSNNFTETLRTADNYNKHVLFDYARLLVWALPSNCWGSKEKVEAWFARGGLTGTTKGPTDAD